LQYLDQTLESLPANLALDEALLLEAEAGRSDEVLRFWEWSTPAVVLGAGGRLTEDVDEPACSTAGVAIQRRASGGGTVLLDAGCLCFTLVLCYDRHPALREIPSSNAFILERLRDALAGLLPGIERAGTSDLTVAGLKFSGNAQQRKRTHLLHHGTLLYAFDIAQVSRYLRLPVRQPDYRHGRMHEAFLRNLPASAVELKHRLLAAWDASGEMTEFPVVEVERLVAQKYGTPEWVRRRP
jgi:lipoate-protein ligase A